MEKIYYYILFEDKFNNQRYLSRNVFSKTELLKNDINSIKKNEYLDKYPDKTFLYLEELEKELKLVTDIGTVPIKAYLNE